MANVVDIAVIWRGNFSSTGINLLVLAKTPDCLIIDAIANTSRTGAKERRENG